jgi:hypothetical protein
MTLNAWSASITFQASAAGAEPGQMFVAGTIFEVDGSDLVLTLSNLGNYDADERGEVLTAVFFDLASHPSLTRVSAMLAPGGAVKGNGGSTDPDGVVGGEWAYDGGLSGAPASARFTISSAGFDLVGPSDLFPGSNLQGPTSPDGVQYGITTVFDMPANDNGGLAGQGLVQNAVVFRLAGLPGGFSVNGISNVSFQYGTSLEELNLPGTVVPEPSAGVLVLIGVGLCLLVMCPRRHTLS